MYVVGRSSNFNLMMIRKQTTWKRKSGKKMNSTYVCHNFPRSVFKGKTSCARTSGKERKDPIQMIAMGFAMRSSRRRSGPGSSTTNGT